MSARSAFPADPDEPVEIDLEPWGPDAVAERVAATGEDAAAPAQPAELASLSMAFGRVSRAARLTEALADRLDHPPSAKAGAAPSDDPMADAAHDRQVQISARGKLAKIFVNRAVEDAIEAEARERGDGFDAEAALETLDRRIGGAETIQEFGTTPWAEMAARICAEIGVPFDDRDGWPEPEDEAGAETHGPPPPRAGARACASTTGRRPSYLPPASTDGCGRRGADRAPALSSRRPG